MYLLASVLATLVIYYSFSSGPGKANYLYGVIGIQRRVMSSRFKLP